LTSVTTPQNAQHPINASVLSGDRLTANGYDCVSLTEDAIMKSIRVFSCVLSATCALAFFCGQEALADINGIAYVNNNPPMNIVPFGGSFTYSVTWTTNIWKLGYVSLDGLTLNNRYIVDYGGASYPLNYTYSYTINGVDSSNDGYYHLLVFDFIGGFATANIYLHISPAILTQPRDTTCLAGSSTTMGIRDIKRNLPVTGLALASLSPK